MGIAETQVYNAFDFADITRRKFILLFQLNFALLG